MIHTSILDEKRLSHLPALARVSADFYLAGGTALALQIGHRDSIDFDFFHKGDIDTTVLFSILEKEFVGIPITKTQETINTLSVIVDSDIRVSFFGYRYPLLQATILFANLQMAQMLDIGCMKLSAITGRASVKDYVDLYYILQTIPLADLLTACKQKLPMLDTALLLKSIVYTDDLLDEPIMFKPRHEITIPKIKRFMEQTVATYWNTL
jgi:hypothetical protein